MGLYANRALLELFYKTAEKLKNRRADKARAAVKEEDIRRREGLGRESGKKG